MDGSLLVLSKLRLKGGLRKLKRTLLTPKGIVPGLFTLAFLGLMLVPLIAARFTPPEVREHFNFNRFLHPAALAGLWLVTLAGGRMKSPIAFTLPEVEFLFPGPFTRRQLLAYKLAIDALAALGFVVLVPLFVVAYLAVWWPAALLGFWLTMVFVQMLSVIVALGLDLAGAAGPLADRDRARAGRGGGAVDLASRRGRRGARLAGALGGARRQLDRADPAGPVRRLSQRHPGILAARSGGVDRGCRDGQRRGRRRDHGNGCQLSRSQPGGQPAALRMARTRQA